MSSLGSVRVDVKHRGALGSLSRRASVLALSWRWIGAESHAPQPSLMP